MRPLAIAILLFAVGCDVEQVRRVSSPNTERPIVNVPRALRQKNWAVKFDWVRNEHGRLVLTPDGSCTHATMVSLFRWQGQPKMADWWRRYHAGAETHATGPNAAAPDSSLAKKLTAAGVRFAETGCRDDVAFLEWACRTRRGCGVAIDEGNHMVALVHLDSRWAAILDNNDTGHFIWVPREEFLTEWKKSGSWAITPVYTPAPPLPHK